MENPETDRNVNKRRSRRSNRCTLYLENDEEICELIDKNLPEDERLKALMKQCIKHSVASTLSDETGSAYVLDIYPVIDSMMTTIEELNSKGVFAEAVSGTKTKKKNCVVDEDLERRINNAGRYIKKLEKEIKEWNRLLDHHQKELEESKNNVENPFCQENNIELIRKPENKNARYEEKLKRINKLRESINRHVDIYNNCGIRMEEYKNNAERQISEFGRKIKLPFDVNQNLVDHLFKI